MLQPSGTLWSRPAEAALHLGSWNNKKQHPGILYCDGWGASSLQGQVVPPRLWWTFQGSLCVWHLLWPGLKHHVHICADHNLQHWHRAFSRKELRTLGQSSLIDVVMFRCFACKSTFATIKQLIRHLKLSHSLFPGKKFQLLRDQNGCRHRFCTFSGFRKHLHSKHYAENLDQNDNEPATVLRQLI